ncbi:TPA: DNA cytosine methyltransferase [Haemophilus influenzae]|uniref:DNA cytosine methyltransferase n=1 Tax=Haemophilus TaxID=724 RepID=UPI000667F8A8|nr:MULTISPECIES: DNA cytosine methyltransferase [Haemophilus]MBZ5717270.1 DNA cytosine methyltransferase [Haemophilus influenzae]MCK8888514.1 DNA cytosine methyltransferase [Haemophilus influenzae]MCK9026673.1 DNA cytosine methyltransferase [Haemophilus influenzae]MCK9132572.1 DNA cytosine methyltransferase [Haemophilus influenzae]MCK9134675.1 DNA cytosine methyltransferase [Haemophilus influenzae]
MFTYGSICSGIEAVSVAWKGLSKPLWFSEIEPFPCAVLAYHYPNIPNLGDMTTLPEKILNREIPAPDVLVGGTPCQAFSIAGLRNSLDDERGNLTLMLIHILEAIDYVRYQDDKQPCILLWENVPGVLSTKDNAFGHFLAGLVQERQPLQPTGRKWTNAGLLHSARTVAWRTLNAQYFGLAQRRKRVFLVASARERSVAQILFERKSLQGHSQSCGKTQQVFTAYTESSFGAFSENTISGTLRQSGGSLGGGSETFVVHGTQDPIISTSTAHCLGRNNGQENVLFDISERRNTVRIYDEITPTLAAKMGTGGNNIPRINRQSIIRKLTPVECERLQGFPDNWTKIPYRNKSIEDCPDSPRYKAIGNSMAVPVIKWIRERLTNYLGERK